MEGMVIMQVHENGNVSEKNRRKEKGMHPYFYMGIAAFLVIASAVTFFFFLFRLQEVKSFIANIISVLSPIIYGLIIAFLLNPIVNFFDRKIKPFLDRNIKNGGKNKVISRNISIFASMFVVLLVLYFLGSLVVPELVNNLMSLIRDLPGQIEAFTNELNVLMTSTDETTRMLRETINYGITYFENWLQSDLKTWLTSELLPNLNEGVFYFAAQVIGVVNVLKNVIIGLIVSVYVLNSKELFASQIKMILYALFKTEIAEGIIDTLRESNKIFSGFISGKIIDSVIIGVLCFIGLSILNMPYTLVVSVIVGITNIIPFFGPFIGAIPSAILILFVSPIHCLYFVIFILILQQLDGNVIGPKILGDSTGLSAFWVIFAILVGGGMFGFAGMVVGVPTLAVVFYVVKRLVRYRLDKKGLPTSSQEYRKDITY